MIACVLKRVERAVAPSLGSVSHLDLNRDLRQELKSDGGDHAKMRLLIAARNLPKTSPKPFESESFMLGGLHVG